MTLPPVVLPSTLADHDHCFDRAWRNVHAALLRRARRLSMGDVYLADELLANTALKVFLYLRNGPERVRDPEGFMFLVLDHVFLDCVRKRGREDRVLDRETMIDSDWVIDLAGPGLDPAQAVALQQELDQLDAALARLNPMQRQLFEMRFEQELPYPDIASALQVSEALARKRVELLRKRLHGLMRHA